MSGVKKDMLLKVYSLKERGGSWAALGRLWAGFAGFLAVMCLLGLQGKGQLKMYVVPGGQIPRREQTVGRTTALQCCGGEHELFLCHGGNWLWLQSGNCGAGELWCITPTTITGFFAIQCVGAEKGLSLTHLEGQLQLTCSHHEDPNQMWLVEKHEDACTVSFHNGDQRQYLSHAWGWLSCQDGFLGAGVLWKPAAGAVVD